MHEVGCMGVVRFLTQLDSLPFNMHSSTAADSDKTCELYRQISSQPCFQTAINFQPSLLQALVVEVSTRERGS